MAIPAKRFEFLDKTTNVPVTDFITVRDSDIRNITTTDITTVMNRISNMFNNVVDDASGSLSDLSDATMSKLKDLGVSEDQMSKLFRNTTGVSGMMTDIINLPNKLYDSLMDDMFPEGGVVKNLAKDVFKICSRGGQGLGNMRPFDVNLDCNGNSLSGNSGSCKPSGISNLLNTLTKGAYGSSLSDINSLINAAVSLALASYDANLCGGFGASITGLKNDIKAINRTGILTMMGLANSHNVRGTMDVLNTIDTTVVKNDYPEATKGIIGNPTIDKEYYGTDGLSPFKTQYGVDDRSIKDIYTGMLDSSSLVDNNWNRAPDGILSISNITNNDDGNILGNTGFKAMSGYVLNNNSLDTNNLSSINSNVDDTLAMLYSTL